MANQSVPRSSRSTTRSTAAARSRTPATKYKSSSKGWDWRWIVVGAVALLIAGVVAVNVSNSMTASSVGMVGNFPIGEVTERGQTPQAPDLLPVGSRAPNLQWRINGQDGSLAQLQGRPVLLEFFATWCPHCQSTAPKLTRIQQRFGDQIGLITVNASPVGMDQRSPAGALDLQNFARRTGANYQVLLDPDLVGARRFGIRGFPTIYLIDRNGIIASAEAGDTDENTLVQRIQNLLTQ
ncbi:MAG: TlpA family protein disulfide reductase [Dehalococcoidia bacterium]|nr:TlpA family protein disulfide reductase [Dehalococcoidia bacterium]